MKQNVWLIPIGFVVVGLALVGAGIAWAVVSGVAVPDQDPTPAMQTYARLHLGLSQTMLIAGLCALALAVLSLPVVIMVKRIGRRRTA